jgi:hypothetical protein
MREGRDKERGCEEECVQERVSGCVGVFVWVGVRERRSRRERESVCVCVLKICVNVEKCVFKKGEVVVWVCSWLCV